MLEKTMNEIKETLELHLKAFLEKSLNDISIILKDGSSFVTADRLPPRKSDTLHTVSDLSRNTYEYKYFLSVKIEYSIERIAKLKSECQKYNQQAKQDKTKKWPIHYIFDKPSKSWLFYSDYPYLLEKVSNYCQKFLNATIYDQDF